MALIPITGGWRGFSTSKEATFGAREDPDTSLNFYGDFMDAAPEKVWDDKDEFTGELAPTRVQVLTSKTEGKHGQNLTPHAAGLFFSWLTGNCTSAAVTDGAQNGIYSHTISTDKNAIELVSRTMREFDGSDYMEYPGCVCTDVQLSGSREEFCKIEASLIGMGKESVVSPDPERPTLVAESYLSYGDVHIVSGGSYNGTAFTGGTDLAQVTQNFKLSVKNGGKLQYFFGDQTTFAGRAIRGRMFDIGLDMKQEFVDRSAKAAMMAGTTFGVSFAIVGGLIGTSTTNNYECRVVLPKVAFAKVKRGQDDGLLTLDASYRVLADATYGPVVIHVKNLQASYL